MKSIILPALLIAASFSLSACSDIPAARASDAQSSQPKTGFDAKVAWDEFESYFKLYYAYKDRSDFDAPAVLAKTKAIALQQDNKNDFRKVLARMGYAFTDPHLIFGPLTSDDYNVFPSSADIVLGHQGGQYVVQDVRAQSPAFDAGVRPGNIVETINGERVEDIPAQTLAGLTDALTSKQKAYTATLAVNGRRSGIRDIGLNLNGEDKILMLASPRDFAMSLRDDPILAVTYPRNNIALIRINNSLGNNDLINAFDAAMKDVSDADHLIIDLRNTPSGGNTEVARSLIGHFLRDLQPYQVHEIPSLEREFSVPRHFVEYAKPRAPYFDPQKTVVLGGPWTGSMGEGLVIGLNAAADMTTIASDMGDLLGGLSNFDLPASSIRLDMGTETLFHINGTPREDYVADIALLSADTNTKGEDSALKAALKHFGVE